MTFVNDFFRKKSLFFKCLAVSCAIHIGILIYFYAHPILVRPDLRFLFNLSSASPDLLEYEEENLENVEKNRIMEEVFREIFVTSSDFQQPLDLAELPKSVALAPHTEESLLEETSSETMDWSYKQTDGSLVPQEALAFREDSPARSLLFPEQKGADFITQIQIDQGLPRDFAAQVKDLDLEEVLDLEELDLNLYSQMGSIETPVERDSLAVDVVQGAIALPFHEKKQELSASSLAASKDPGLEFASESLLSSHPLSSSPEKKRELDLLAKAVPKASFPSLEKYDLPDVKESACWNEDFTASLQFLPDEERGGYFFSVSLKSNSDLKEHALKQHIHFIIDRSSSVKKHRFAVFKRAISKALASMQAGDTFNIYVVDKKVIKLSSQMLFATAKNIRLAEAFLEKQQAGTLFSSSEIYSSLNKIFSDIPENAEMHTAIVLTDGTTSYTGAKQQEILKNWLQKNTNKVSLYTAAVGQKNNTMMLDLLSSISGGKMLYSDTHAAFPRKVAKLVLDLKHPLARDLMVTAVTENSPARIEFYTASSHLQPLYANQPYVIYGHIDQPCDFDLILQGRHEEEWIAIKKKVLFSEGKKATRNLEKQWLAERAKVHYSRFLADGKNSHLKEAEAFLQ